MMEIFQILHDSCPSIIYVTDLELLIAPRESIDMRPYVCRLMFNFSVTFVLWKIYWNHNRITHISLGMWPFNARTARKHTLLVWALHQLGVLPIGHRISYIRRITMSPRSFTPRCAYCNSVVSDEERFVCSCREAIYCSDVHYESHRQEHLPVHAVGLILN